MSLLDPAAPQAAEVGAVNASLESLQSTLGAAYMLLAAECKAETLEAQVSLARAGTLASLPAEARTACQAKNHEDP